MNNYEPVIGIEVHVELNTKTKMFCRCSADYFGKQPNTHTCPVCLGLPGALPHINEEAINKCVKIGLALNCKVSEKSIFERKNYFYPDLPKGYQISQYRWPLCINGQIEVEDENGAASMIRVNRVHQEEDTGKLTHLGSETLIDFNRSGVPLVEIVTEPDFTDSSQVKDYAKKLQQIFRYLEVSNADMERGDMRLEANVSLRELKTQNSELRTDLPNYRVELKNINSFRFMVAAIEYEIKRQIEALERGEKLTQETRGWDEDKKCTYLQRSKEEAHDYRYFPEPDLPQIFLDSKKIQQVRDSLPELPNGKRKKYREVLKIREMDAAIISESPELAGIFESAVEHGKKHSISAQDIAKYIVNKKPNISSILPTQIIEAILGKGIGMISDAKELEGLSIRAINSNNDVVKDYKSGKEPALQVLIGAVMRESGGKANARKTKEILLKLLKAKNPEV